MSLSANLDLPCASCDLAPVCFHLDGDHAMPAFPIVHTTVRRGETLFAGGDDFRHVFAVRAGSFKTMIVDRHGSTFVTGFHLPGDLLGLDGLADGSHHCEAVALETSQVCGLRYADLRAACAERPEAGEAFARAMARGLARQRAKVAQLRAGREADSRLARFLVDWAERLRCSGMPGCELILAMTRVDIASFLGLGPETVSRAFTRLQRTHVLQVENRSVTIESAAALSRIAEGFREIAVS